MRILLNFATLKKGGGQSVALNFLNVVKNKGLLKHYYYVVAKNSLTHEFLKENKCVNFTVVSTNPIIRIIFEVFCSWRILKALKINIIYTYFGIGLFPSKYLQVIGSADSNLYFPDIDFWKHYKGIALLKRKIIDKYRIMGIYRADGIIFENGIMEGRCHELYKVRGLTTTIFPSISLDYPERRYYMPPVVPSDSDIEKGLFLCGWHMNKNIMIIPLLARQMKEQGINFHFIFTAPNDQSELNKKFIDLLFELNVEDMVSIVGPVLKEELKSLYSQINFIFLLSKLESFSNNIIEAWTYKKVLIVADEPWAHALCKDAAIFVKRDSVEDIVLRMNDVLNNEQAYQNIIDKGMHERETYPTAEEKYNQEISFLKKVYGKA